MAAKKTGRQPESFPPISARPMTLPNAHLNQVDDFLPLACSGQPAQSDMPHRVLGLARLKAKAVQDFYHIRFVTGLTGKTSSRAAATRGLLRAARNSGGRPVVFAS